MRHYALSASIDKTSGFSAASVSIHQLLLPLFCALVQHLFAYDGILKLLFAFHLIEFFLSFLMLIKFLFLRTMIEAKRKTKAKRNSKASSCDFHG